MLLDLVIIIDLLGIKLSHNFLNHRCDALGMHAQMYSYLEMTLNWLMLIVCQV